MQYKKISISWQQFGFVDEYFSFLSYLDYGGKSFFGMFWVIIRDHGKLKAWWAHYNEM